MGVCMYVHMLCSSNAFLLSWESEFSPWTQDEEMCSPLVCFFKIAHKKCTYTTYIDSSEAYLT